MPVVNSTACKAPVTSPSPELPTVGFYKPDDLPATQKVSVKNLKATGNELFYFVPRKTLRYKSNKYYLLTYLLTNTGV